MCMLKKTISSYTEIVSFNALYENYYWQYFDWFKKAKHQNRRKHYIYDSHSNSTYQIDSGAVQNKKLVKIV